MKNSQNTKKTKKNKKDSFDEMLDRVHVMSQSFLDEIKKLSKKNNH